MKYMRLKQGGAKTQTMAWHLVNTLLPSALEHPASVSVESVLTYVPACGGLFRRVDL